MRRFTRNHRLKPGPGTVRLDPDHFAGRPAAFWLMNEGGGSIHDLSGNGNTGTPNGGVTCVPSVVGIARKFDGSTGYATTAFAPSSVTATYLARVLSQGSGHRGVIARYPNWFIDLNSGVPGWFDLNIGHFYSSGVNINDGGFHDICFCIDSFTAANGIRIYVDGQFRAFATGSGDSSSSLQIGTESGTLNSFQGTIVNAAVYPFAITAAQVWQVYQRPYDMLIPSGARRGFVGATASGQTLAAGVASISVTDAAPGVVLGTASEQAGVANIAAAVSAPDVALGTATAPAGVTPIGVAVAPPPLALGPVTQAAGAASISLAEASPALQLGPIAPAAGIANLALVETAPAISLGAATAAAGDAEIGLQEIAPAIAGQAQPTNEVWQPRSRGTIWWLE